MNHSLSDKEIKKLTDNGAIYTYSELTNPNVNMIDLLNKEPNKTIICLVRQTPSYGHWICIFLKTKGSEIGIHVFDSYGNIIDSKKWFNGIPKDVLKELGEDSQQLIKSLYKLEIPIYYNQYKYQSNDLLPSGEPIQTCGFHSVLRATFNDLDTNEYHNLIKKKCIQLHMTPDELVVSMLQAFL